MSSQPKRGVRSYPPRTPYVYGPADSSTLAAFVDSTESIHGGQPTLVESAFCIAFISSVVQVGHIEHVATTLSEIFLGASHIVSMVYEKMNQH